MKLTPEIAKAIIQKAPDAKQILSSHEMLKGQYKNYICFFEFSGQHIRHIVVAREPANKNNIIVYVNQKSINHVPFLESCAKSIPVSKKYPKGSKCIAGENSFISSDPKLSSLTPDYNDVLCLTVSTPEDFHLLLNWYADLPFEKELLEQMLLNKNYSFPGSTFEPSNKEDIAKNKLTFEKLAHYLSVTYDTGTKPYDNRKHIETIIGEQYAKELINLEKSEYFKILSHFAILSKVKRQWYDLFFTGFQKESKPSLSDNPELSSDIDSKKLNDAIVQCFYYRLIEGIKDCDKQRYKILLGNEQIPCGFDELLKTLDKAIQKLSSFEHQKIPEYDSEEKLPDYGFDLAIKKTRDELYRIFNKDTKQKYSADKLRVALIKHTSINRAINEIDAIINNQNEAIKSLPHNIQSLASIRSESDILKDVAKILDVPRSYLPDDLIKCAKLMCQMYIYNSLPYNKKYIPEFVAIHTQPNAIAISAALLCYDSLNEKEINFHIRGENNPDFAIYNILSCFAKDISFIDNLKPETLSEHKFPAEVFKFLTTRYSISMFGLSDFYASQEGAIAHVNVRRGKLALQQEAYELLKGISINEAHEKIITFSLRVDEICDGPSAFTDHKLRHRVSGDAGLIIDPINSFKFK